MLGWCTFRRVLVSWAILRSVAPSKAGLVYLLPLPGDLGQFTLRRGPVRPELGWFTFRRTQVTFRRILVNRAGLRSVAAGCAGLAYVSLRPSELGWLASVSVPVVDPTIRKRIVGCLWSTQRFEYELLGACGRPNDL